VSLVRGDTVVTARPESLEPQGPEPRSQGLTSCVQRLLDLHAAAAYLGISYWMVRDFVANGTLPTVKLPTARIDAGRRRNGKPGPRLLVARDDPRLAGATARRILIDVRDLDALIERSKCGESGQRGRHE